MKYIHERAYHARYIDVDFKDELKPSSILAYLQEAACTSADELGFGYEVIRKKNLGFITANTYVKILNTISIEDFKVLTWPTPPRHVVFDRQYEMFNSKGEKAVLACSRWCLIDMNTFKMLPASVLSDQDYSGYNTDKAVASPQWKVAAYEKESAEKRFMLDVFNSEYDHYMHVNNTKYADYIFNCFSVEELKNQSLDSFSVNYIKQAHEGDSLAFYRIKNDERNYSVYGFNQQEELVVSGNVIFK